jgi:DNA-binding NarL/FixJ family response regulator
MEEESLTTAVLVREESKSKNTDQHRIENPARLTKREREVLSLLCDGLSSKEVADAIYVSKRTVDFHLSKIYEKLGVENRAKAYCKAIELGYVEK